MSEHQIETAFLSRAILYDDSDAHRQLEKSIAQVLRDERCVQRMASLTTLFLVLAIAGVAYASVLEENFPYNTSEAVIRVFCELVLASLICLAGFAGLLTIYRKKLNRLRNECRQLVVRLLESHLGNPHRAKLRVNDPVSDEREAFQIPSRSGT